MATETLGDISEGAEDFKAPETGNKVETHEKNERELDKELQETVKGIKEKIYWVVQQIGGEIKDYFSERTLNQMDGSLGLGVYGAGRDSMESKEIRQNQIGALKEISSYLKGIDEPPIKIFRSSIEHKTNKDAKEKPFIKALQTADNRLAEFALESIKAAPLMNDEEKNYVFETLRKEGGEEWIDKDNHVKEDFKWRRKADKIAEVLGRAKEEVSHEMGSYIVPFGEKKK